MCAAYVTALPHPAELGAPESYDAKIENIVPAEEHHRYIRSGRSYGGGRHGGYGGRHGGYGGGRGGYGGYGGYGGGRHG